VVDDDTLRILVATDTHIGYNEKDEIRGRDALNTFEEVLQIARQKNADFVLHGGDLFHDNKPSRGCLYRTMDLMRRYCFGPRDVGFQVVSDPMMFSRGMVNYEDPNVNIDMPIFMIHGNHDDPGGENNLSAANLLEVNCLVNYFGRQEDLEDIVVKPVLFRKGRTQLAIYGFGNIRDERLHRAFQTRKVRFETPTNPEQWFNIMILHQNRFKGNAGGILSKSAIHEQMLPKFLDLVLWGHEHDCAVQPQESLQGEFYVVQPGSSVATSLTPGETNLKHVALIDIRDGVFRCMPEPLWSVRPLMMNDVCLAESGLLKTDMQSIWNKLTSEVEALIGQGMEENRRRKQELEARGSVGTMRPVPSPELPLVRLRVEHTGFETIGQSFGQQFIERIANPDEVLHFYKRKTMTGTKGSTAKPGLGDILSIEEAPGPAEAGGGKIQDIIYKYLDGEQNLQILSEPDLNEAVQSFVHRAEPCAIERFVKEAVEATNQAVLSESAAVEEEEIRVQMQDRAERIRQQRLAGSGPTGGSAPGNASLQQGGVAGSLDAGGGSQRAAPVALDGAREQLAFAQRPGDPLMQPLPGSAREAAAARRMEPIRGFAGSQIPEIEDFDEPISQPGRGGRGRGGRGKGKGRGRATKRPSEMNLGGVGTPGIAGDDAFAMPAPPKAPRTVARASGAAAAASMPAQSRGVRDMLQGTLPAESMRMPETGGLAGAMPEAAMATPFLSRRRGNDVGEAGFNDTAAPVEPATSLRQTQTVSRRPWALRQG